MHSNYYSYKLKNLDAKDSYEPLKIQDFLSTNVNNIDNSLISTKKLLLFTKTDYTVLIDDNKPIVTISNFKKAGKTASYLGELEISASKLRVLPLYFLVTV